MSPSIKQRMIERLTLVAPEVFERSRRQRRVLHRVLDRDMAKPRLDAARVMAVRGQHEPACVPEHVRMDRNESTGRPVWRSS
jgi:hypothetical protein